MLLAVAVGLVAGCAQLQPPHPGSTTQPHTATQPAGRISFHELVERLEVLESLRTRGLLTEREYQDAKKPLVDLLASGDVVVSENTMPRVTRRQANDPATAATNSTPVPLRHGFGQDH
jgi:hypothetical protein